MPRRSSAPARSRASLAAVSIDRPAGQAPDVTVVIITHNRPDYLRAALWGLTQQYGGAPPVIVVDDASSPPAELHGFPELDLQLVRNDPGRGACGARNRGLELVTTPWVAFLDDDDVFLPGHLDRVRAAIAGAATPDRVGLVYAPAIVMDAGRRVQGIIRAHAAEDLPRALHGGCPVPTPSCVVTRTEAVRQLGGFDAGLASYGDWDMWLRVTRAGWRAVATTTPSVIYTRHAQSLTGRLDLGLADLATMKARYGDDAARLGVRQPDEGYHSHIGQTLVAGGRRRAATAAYLRSFAVRRKPRDIVLASFALAGRRPPLWMRRVRGLPAEFPAWLEGLRAFEASGDAVASR
jgi:glycosyltransferase involved in cell wall biosynthesis